MQAQPDYSIFDRQDVLPRNEARRLDYDAGFALGLRAGVGNDDTLALLLHDARVLSARHNSVAMAARLMHVAEAGLRGLLNGAGFYVGASDTPVLADAEAA